ncbi:hypothetical protein ACWDG1_44670 [Streptomyces sp. NPDC001177]
MPELDDSDLARVLSHLEAQIAAQGDNLAEANDRGALTYPIEQALRDPGQDWDRRMHRLLVLAALPDAPVLARQWRARRPDSPDALLFQAYAALAQSAADRTDQDVIALCRQAAALLPPDPAPWVGMLTCYRHIHSTTAALRPLWDEIKARDPWNREAHLQILRYLSPDECGSHAQVLSFSDAVRAQAPPRAPVAALALTASLALYCALQKAGGITALTAHRHWSRPQERALIDQALADWLQPGYLTHAAALADLNLLAYVLVTATRPDEAWPVFQMIGPFATAWPWLENGQPLATFQQWHHRARRRAQQRHKR